MQHQKFVAMYTKDALVALEVEFRPVDIVVD